MKHTKGEWDKRKTYYIGFNSERCYFSDIHENVITNSKLICKVWGKTKEECTEYAKLIASAPELLKALQELHHASWEKGCSAQLSEELKKAKQAIKKATE